MTRKADTRRLNRRKPFKKSGKKILIVCEGSVTEPNYFGFLRRRLRLYGVDVKVIGGQCGTDPFSVVQFAADIFNEDKDIDLCACVIDRDTHDSANLSKALNLCSSVNGKSKRRVFQVNISDPCIEYWFILHFEYCRTPFVRAGNKSRGDKAVEKLKSIYPGGYVKSHKNLGEDLFPLTKTARLNASRAMEDAAKTGEKNPSTNLHLLIDVLESEAKFPEAPRS